jgi:RNA polymerase sigma factor (TIGR02999 family)
MAEQFSILLLGGSALSSTISSLIGAVENGVSLFPDALMNITEGGDVVSTDELFNTLYWELHTLARRELARKMAPVSLSVTTLVHEAYLDMSGRAGRSFPDRPRFMGYAARVMRGVIIDHARKRMAIKRGGEFEITSLATDSVESPADAKALSEISDALDQLAKVEPDLAELVDLKFFCGCTFAEIAALQKLSERTVQRRWEKARIYLRRTFCRELSDLENSCPL